MQMHEMRRERLAISASSISHSAADSMALPAAAALQAVTVR